MVLQGATFNAMAAVCVVSLLLFRLPMAMLCIVFIGPQEWSSRSFQFQFFHISRFFSLMHKMCFHISDLEQTSLMYMVQLFRVLRVMQRFTTFSGVSLYTELMYVFFYGLYHKCTVQLDNFFQLILTLLVFNLRNL